MENSMEKVVANVEEVVLNKVSLYIFKKKAKNGKEFNDYCTKTKDGKFVKVKFTIECKEPSEPCILYVKKGDINMTKQKGTQFPVFWIKAIDHSEPLPAQDLSSYFEEV